MHEGPVCILRYTCKAHPNSLSLPSLLRLFHAPPQFPPFLVDKISMKSILMSFRCSSTHIVHFLTSIVNKVLQPLASAFHNTSFFKHSLNVILWLTGVAPSPSCLSSELS